jgi:GntR family transcriptional regulator
VRERGRGTRVRFVSRGTVVRGPSRSTRSRQQSGAKGHTAVRNFHDILSEQDEADYLVFSFDLVSASAEVAQALSLTPRTEVYRALRLGHFEGKPYRYLTTYVPAEIGAHWTKKDLEENPVVALHKRAGTTIERIDESVTATLADAVTSRRLKISTGSPLIKVSRTAFDLRRRPIEYVVALYRPDRFQYMVSMERRS